MKANRAVFILAVVAFLFLRAVHAGQVSWVPGTSCPPTWSIDPNSPTPADVIRFSGPTRLYWSLCSAEDDYGGKPVLDVNNVNKTIELRFDPPPTDGCPLFSRVCGLSGSFGPLPVGQWLFFGSHPRATFSIDLQVGNGGQPPDQPVDQVYFVDANAVGQNNGSSWPDAFVHLQDALAAAAASQVKQIRVAQGLYKPDLGAAAVPGDPNAAFEVGDGLVIKGGYAGVINPDPGARDVTLYRTILSADLAGNDLPDIGVRDLLEHPSRADNAYHVIITSPTGPALLDGLTITGGNANGSRVPNIYSVGGAIYCGSAELTLNNCRMVRNSACYYGGAIANSSKPGLTLINCTLNDNYAYWWGGAIYNDFSGVLRMVRCIVRANAARFHGGALYSNGLGRVDLSNCLVEGNAALDAVWSRGGALYTDAASLTVEYCTIVGNRAAGGSTLAFDSLDTEQPSRCEAANSIFWDGADPIWNNDQSDVNMVCCDVAGGWPGEGNIEADPCFVTMGYWDDRGTPADPCDDLWLSGQYQLLDASPCVDAGDPNNQPDPNTTDLAGNLRLHGPRTDIGAYETTNDPPTAHAGDDQTTFSPDGAAVQITLDGSGSIGPAGVALDYMWFKDAQQIATGVEPTIDLPLGEHVIELTVNDGKQDSPPDQVTVTVLDVLRGTMSVYPEQIYRPAQVPRTWIFVRMPSHVSWDRVDASWSLVLYPGGLKPQSQSVFRWFGTGALVVACFDSVSVAKVLPEGSHVELQVIGKLRDGRFFWAGKNVPIVH